jgi:hypothetical protein
MICWAILYCKTTSLVFEGCGISEAKAVRIFAKTTVAADGPLRLMFIVWPVSIAYLHKLIEGFLDVGPSFGFGDFVVCTPPRDTSDQPDGYAVV